MRIQKLEIENFRGLENITFRPDKPLNVIVGPNAVGKSTILEAIRLAKAMLAPRYFQETQQALISLGAMSQQFMFFGTPQQIDMSAIARDTSKTVRVRMEVGLSADEVSTLSAIPDQLAGGMLRTSIGRTDEQGQIALTQFLSSEQGQAKLKEANEQARGKLAELQLSKSLTLELLMRPNLPSQGVDLFSQIAFSALEQRLTPQLTMLDYFPADRAFPFGETNVQIGSADASVQIQSYVGQPAQKYARLKQTFVHGLITSQLDAQWINREFDTILSTLVPGKRFHGLHIGQTGQLKILIMDVSSQRVFDIDSMSSGEKGVILSFLLIRQTMANGGILLLDEPELHLNPAVCKKVIPFLLDQSIEPKGCQAFICTHSPEILGAAFDRDDSNLFHLRSGTDITKVYRKDRAEMFEALKRLGASTADVLFSKGNIFVEGDHDAEVLDEGFFDLVSGYKVAKLGGRAEVEKAIINLQSAEKRNEVEKVNLLIFDLDRMPTTFQSSALVKVTQWDRYCLENYLLDERAMFDVIIGGAKHPPESRGSFDRDLKNMAISQLESVIIRQVYAPLEPDNPGLRPSEIDGKDIGQAATILGARLKRISSELLNFQEEEWATKFVTDCELKKASLREVWSREWKIRCDGKKLMSDLQRRYQINMDLLSFKKRVVRQMKADRADDWLLVERKLKDGLSAGWQFSMSYSINVSS